MFSLLRTVIGKVFENGEAVRAQQARLNEIELGGAPASRLRLWRSFLGWVLACAFCWEVVRGMLAAWWPGASLPPSMAKEVTTLLMGMLGFGL